MWNITHTIAVDGTGVIPAAEEDRTAWMVCISRNAWFLKVGLYHCMPFCDELEDDDISRIGGQIVWVV
jgi:hypothetical protein